MKKIILFLAISISTTSIAQKFVVTPIGLKDESNLGTNYVAITSKGKSAADLYFLSVKFMNKFYNNADASLKDNIGNNNLKFKISEPDFIKVRFEVFKQSFDAKYKIELLFEDGIVKYEIIDLDMRSKMNFKIAFMQDGISFNIYNTNQKLKNKDSKIAIENYFNANLKSYVDFLNAN